MEAGGRNSRMKTHHELLHSRDFQCCCCFHVRTGTIALGLLHVMMQMTMVAVITTALLNPDLLSEDVSGAKTITVDMDANGRLEIQRGAGGTDGALGQLTQLVRTSRQDLHYLLFLSTFFGFVSMLLMYGAIWGQPSYLMPFFAIMCFDFANAMLRLIGSFAERHAAASPASHNGGDPMYGFIIMLSVILKAYLLNMVWSCYKFLRLRQELLRRPMLPATQAGCATAAAAGHGHHGGASHVDGAVRGIGGTTDILVAGPGAAAGAAGLMEASNLLPDYETTQKSPYDFYPSPPPPYATATQMPSVASVVMPPPSYQEVAEAAATTQAAVAAAAFDAPVEATTSTQQHDETSQSPAPSSVDLLTGSSVVLTTSETAAAAAASAEAAGAIPKTAGAPAAQASNEQQQPK